MASSRIVTFARIACAIAATLGATACAAESSGTFVDASAATVSPNPWPSAPVAAPDAAPQIVALWMNETTIPSGSEWIGRAVTSTNVASLEVRTESFSFIADRDTFGEFHFDQHVLDMVPFYKRPYVLHVIARNAAGERDERLVRIAFK